MPAGKGRPYNKGVRVMNRHSYGSGTRASGLNNMKDEIENGKSKRKTTRAASDWDKHWKETNKGKVPVGNRLKRDNYGKGNK